MTSLLYEHYKALCDSKRTAYSEEIKALAKSFVDEGKTFEDMAELYSQSHKCIEFDHRLFCYYLHYKLGA